MTIDVINPKDMHDSVPMGYSHAVKSNGNTTIHFSGQVAWNKNREIVGGDDIGLQANQVLTNLKTVLGSAGAQVSDVVRLRTYVVNLNPSLLEPIGQAIAEFYGKNIPVANTMIGVQSLALPEFLIEIEATAEISQSLTDTT